MVVSKSTLLTGETSITFTDERITTDTMFSFYTSIWGTSPTEVSISTGSVTLTFDAQESDMEVGVRIDG